MENVIYKIQEIVNNLELDLSGKIVLTEAATGPYVVTPIIAAYAGAQVFAFTKDSIYGDVQTIREQTNLLSRKLNVENKIEILTELNSYTISQADIITNSGHLRPITESILKFSKAGCVIPSMYEDWELREDDINLEYCKKNNIKVIATNERHPQIDVFNYLGELALKQIHDADITTDNKTFIVIANNDFGPYIANTIVQKAKKVGVFDFLSRKNQYSKEVEWLGDFTNVRIPGNYKSAEAIIFTAHPFTTKWFSKNNELNLDAFKEIERPFIIRFAGDVDTESLEKNNISYYPQNIKPGHMGILLSDLGFDPIIKLQAGGLKVGQLGLINEYKFQNITIGKLI